MLCSAVEEATAPLARLDPQWSAIAGGATAVGLATMVGVAVVALLGPPGDLLPPGTSTSPPAAQPAALPTCPACKAVGHPPAAPRAARLSKPAAPAPRTRQQQEQRRRREQFNIADRNVGKDLGATVALVASMFVATMALL